MLISKGKRRKTVMESRMRRDRGLNRFIVILRLHRHHHLLGESRMAHREQDYLSLVETMQRRLEKWLAVL